LKNARNVIRLGLAPLIGGLMLFGVAIYTETYYGHAGTSNRRRSSVSRCRCGWASAACPSASR
jgi:hypothetical protein